MTLRNQSKTKTYVLDLAENILEPLKQERKQTTSLALYFFASKFSVTGCDFISKLS